MTIAIVVEDAGWEAIPALEGFARQSTAAAFAGAGVDGDGLDISILFTGDGQVAALNAAWRGKDNATNVLSFPAGNLPVPAGEARPLGDIALAFGVVSSEAADQGKTLPGHTAHLIVHGVLHLLGFGHAEDEAACAMERLETEILKGLGISDPYERQ